MKDTKQEIRESYKRSIEGFEDVLPKEFLNTLTKIEMKKRITSVLKNIQRQISTPVKYGELQANDDLVDLYNDVFPKGYYKGISKEDEKIRSELHTLYLAIHNIAVIQQQNHWGMVVCSQIGWFLTWLNKQ